MSERTALYRIWGDANLLLYIGVSDDFGRRWTQHAKQQPWWDEMKRLTADEWFDQRVDAETTEAAAIKAEKPKYNKRHMGPRSYRRSQQNCDALTLRDGDTIAPTIAAVIIAAARKAPEQTGFACMDADVACLRGGFGCIGYSNRFWPCLLTDARDATAESVTGEEARRLIAAAAEALREAGQ